MINGYTIVDGHAHTFSSDEVSVKIIQSFNRLYEIEFENPGTGTIEDVVSNMRDIGIDYTVMANFAPPKILHENNKWTISVSKCHPNLVPLVSFHPEMEGSLAKYLESYMEEGAKGIKIHPMAQGFPPGHPRLDEVYRLCSEADFPVVFHCGRVANARINEYADIDMILPVIEKYPGVKFVLTHMADGNAENVCKLAEDFDNVYFDTSIVITGYPPIMETNKPSWLDDSMVVDIINSIGARRVLFGSDYPWGSPKHDLERIMKMDLDDGQKRLIFGENAIGLFGLEAA